MVTGAGGFLGRQLCVALRPHHELIEVDLPGRSVPTGTRTVSILHPEELAQVVDEWNPEIVIHAAFVNRKPADWTEACYYQSVRDVNAPLFDVCSRRSVSVLLVSSSAVYAPQDGDEGANDPPPCITEDHAVNPVSVYGRAKALQESLAERTNSAGGLHLCIVRLFNLCGPGQQEGMLLPDWVNRAVAIAGGGEPVLRVRNRTTSRDLVDVRDAARAIGLLVRDFRPGSVVNVASGFPVKLMEISDELARLCPVPYEVIETEPFPDSANVVSQCGSFERIRDGWGWAPVISWQQSLADLWVSTVRQRLGWRVSLG